MIFIKKKNRREAASLAQFGLPRAVKEDIKLHAGLTDKVADLDVNLEYKRGKKEGHGQKLEGAIYTIVYHSGIPFINLVSIVRIKVDADGEGRVISDIMIDADECRTLLDVAGQARRKYLDMKEDSAA